MTLGGLPLRTSQLYYSVAGSGGEPVVERDWDNLIILDACRADTFSRRATLPGETDERTCVAATTDEFVRTNFREKTFHDTVYVTANPRVDVNATVDSFHAIVDVWEDGWDERVQTVRPERMTEAVLATADDYPNKRIIAHYVQPHAPFVGPTAEEIPAHSTQSDHRELARGGEPSGEVANVWQLLDRGEVSHETVVAAYEENVELAIRETERLLSSLTGRTAVTADHATLLGERVPPLFARTYGHPVGIYPPALVTVPWHVAETDARKHLRSEPPTESTAGRERGETVVEDRLSDLGYV
jgi:hypothetical protein